MKHHREHLREIPGATFFSRYLGEEVSVPVFWISPFAVSVAEFGEFARETSYTTTAEQHGLGYVFENGSWSQIAGASWRTGGHPGAQEDDHPVVQISRLDAEAYARWSGGRLPKPEEWELAASGGRDVKFPWGDDVQTLDLCLCGRASFQTRGRKESPPAAASVYGCFEMLGNVWEWTQGESLTHSACGVFMGGGWWDAPGELSCWCSHSDDPPTFSVDDVGFRLVMDDANS